VQSGQCGGRSPGFVIIADRISAYLQRARLAIPKLILFENQQCQLERDRADLTKEEPVGGAVSDSTGIGASTAGFQEPAGSPDAGCTAW